MMKTIVKTLVIGLCLSTALSLMSCNRPLTRQEKGALVGGALGTGVGALVGRGPGAIIGGAGGAVLGAAVTSR